MISESLEPCPFCGAAAVYHNQGSGWGVVTCSAGKHTCAANPHIYDREAEARNAWNTRTPQGVASAAANPNPARPPAQGVDVGKLRDALTEFARLFAALADDHVVSLQPVGYGAQCFTTVGDLRQALATPSSDGEGNEPLFERVAMMLEKREFVACWNGGTGHELAGSHGFDNASDFIAWTIRQAYHAGWSDREDDLILGVDRIAPATPSPVSLAIGGDFSSLPPTSTEGQGL